MNRFYKITTPIFATIAYVTSVVVLVISLNDGETETAVFATVTALFSIASLVLYAVRWIREGNK